MAPGIVTIGTIVTRWANGRRAQRGGDANTLEGGSPLGSRRRPHGSGPCDNSDTSDRTAPLTFGDIKHG